MANIVVPALQNATITWSQPAESLFGPPLRSPAASHLSTRTRLKPHTVCCRVRRKRQRLPSNGSIESDAAISCRPTPEVSLAASLPIEFFYEKVVKVKADVAAILNFFSPQIEADHHDAAPVPIGGIAQGGFQRSALKPLLRGEPRHRCVPALFAGKQRASGVGGTRPPRLSPGGGNGKGGVQTSLLPQAVRAGVAPVAGTPVG